LRAGVVGDQSARLYTFNPVTKAIGYQWRQRSVQAYNLVDGAENGLTNFNMVSAGTYSLTASDINASGLYSFHLAQPDEKDQTLTLNRTLLPRRTPSSSSKAAWVSPLLPRSRKSRFLTTLSPGRISTRNPEITPLSPLSLSTRFHLSNYVGRSMHLRFDYTYLGGSFYPQTSSGVGWYWTTSLSPTRMKRAHPLAQPLLERTSPSFPGSGRLPVGSTRKVFGGYFLPRSSSSVTVISNAVVQITAMRYLSASTSKLTSWYLAARPRLSTLHRNQHSGTILSRQHCTLQTITPGLSYRATSTASGPRRCYRIRVL